MKRIMKNFFAVSLFFNNIVTVAAKISFNKNEKTVFYF